MPLLKQLISFVSYILFDRGDQVCKEIIYRFCTELKESRRQHGFCVHPCTI